LTNGERLGYRECGSGANLLFLHGNFTCSSVFEPLMSKLEKHVKCIAPCMRGFGYSSYEKPIESL
jgi:pimeloyl-ACP methyl ester carboxylesterase